ncbi:MAG: trimethylamine methyltransferase family protein, partial [Candidatus Limnocylindrales bacterium]
GRAEPWRVVRPRLELLEPALVERALGEAFELLADPGVRVGSPEAAELLAGAGASVGDGVARLPEALVRQALATVPRTFALHDRTGRPTVRYGAGEVHFDPGSCGVHVLDPETLEHRTSQAADLVRLVQVAEQLPEYAAQSTAVICADVPAAIGDFYRLFLVLLHADKPVVTGAFTAQGSRAMVELLTVDAGGTAALIARPRAIFDVCPSPPLDWSAFGSQNLMDLARAGVPVQLVSMPLAGGAAPVTLIGSVVQHAAECLSGIAIHQLARSGSPIVWGGAPAILDMRVGSTPMGAIETAMLDVACAQVGRSLGLPTHGYLGASDAKLVDAQAGLESGVGAVLGALGGIDLISGAGMLDFLLCQSAEKLVVDAEAIAMALRLVRGVGTPTPSLATATFAAVGLEGRFLQLEETRRLFRSEHHIPSPVIDRASNQAWRQAGAKDTFARARARVEQLLASYRRPLLAAAAESGLIELARREAERAGLGSLAGLEPMDGSGAAPS